MVLECSSSGYRVSRSMTATLSEIKALISNTGIIFTHQTEAGLITAETHREEVGGLQKSMHSSMMLRKVSSCINTERR